MRKKSVEIFTLFTSKYSQTPFWTKSAVRGVFRGGLFRGLTVLHFRLNAKFSLKFVNSSLTLCDTLFENAENF